MTDPIACSLPLAGLDARRADWQGLAERALLEAIATGPAAVRQRYRADAGVAEELERLAALERECCPFLSLTVRREPAAMILEVSGPAEAGPVLELFLAAAE